MRSSLLLLFICFANILVSQNYITDYHQPSILGHEEILKGDFYKAIEYLEQCVSQEKVFAPELYSLGICYFLTNQIDEGKNKIIESYKLGHTPRAIIQDSSVLCSYISPSEFEVFRDSCLSTLITNDSLWKIQHRNEIDEMEVLFTFQWKAAVIYDSLRQNMDSAKYAITISKYKASNKKKLHLLIDGFIEKYGWESISNIIEPQNFSYIVIPLSESSIENYVVQLYSELEKGNVTPGFYANLFDCIEKKYTGKTKYRNITNPNIFLPEKERELLQNDCFQIGIGKTQVLYLKYREYKY